MTAARLIKIFRNGRNQALRIPREVELDTSEASIRKDRGRLIIEPIKKVGLLATLATLSSLKEELPDISGELPPIKNTDL
jgi:antitoxin VapB